MKKTTTLLSFLILLAAHSFTFSQLRVNVTGGYQANMGDFNGGSRDGYGFDASLRFNAMKKMQWGISTGLYRMADAFRITFSDNQTGNTISVDATLTEQQQPIMVGFDHFFSTNRLRPYYGLEAGIYLTKYLLTSDDKNVEISNPNSGIEVNYGGAFTFGILYDINDRIALNTRLKYNGLAYANSGYNSLLGASAGLSFVIGN
jgi:hypothetical protein